MITSDEMEETLTKGFEMLKRTLLNDASFNKSKLVTHYNPYKLRIKPVAKTLLGLHDLGKNLNHVNVTMF